MTTSAPAPDLGRLAAEVKAVAEKTAKPVLVVDGDGVIHYANPAFGWLTGRLPSSLEGVPVWTMMHPDDRDAVKAALEVVLDRKILGESIECRVRGGDGTWKTILASASFLLDLTSSAAILVSGIDLTEARAKEEVLRDQALRDPVTGLANRRALRQWLDAHMDSECPLGVAFIDVDHFKRVNDSLGHTVGDSVLDALGKRIGSLLPVRSIVAHFGADNFVVGLAGLSRERTLALVWELLRRLKDPLYFAGTELCLSASAGVALREEAATSESILRDADAALTRAKALRRGGVELFTETMRIKALERLALESDLRHALEEDQIQLHFQPVVDLATEEVFGCEALARWTRPDGTEVPPDTFVGLAEEAGLIVDLGNQVLALAAAALHGGVARRVSVNLSTRQLLDPGLPPRVERLLAAEQIQPGTLVFEITETVVVQNHELAVECLNRLRRLGCPVGLDDFGTGYSSLSYLRRLPVDFLKLDRELIAEIDLDPQAAQIAEAVVHLARSLQLVTVAEGVERREQANALLKMGCQLAQGWLFAPAAPAPAHVARRRTSPAGPGPSARS